MKNRIFYIPGWMNTLGTYGNPSGMEIWDGGFDLDADIDSVCVVGHSMGANFTLINRARRGEGKIILVNPLFPRRNLFVWYIRLKLFHLKEGKNGNAEHAKGWRNFFCGIRNAARILSFDPRDLLEKIPKEDIVVVRGRGDEFLCNEKAVDFIRGFGIELIEVDGSGHRWDGNIQKTVDKLLESWI
ncbi:MAG: alpha/beta hydrolase [Candidatus Moranbacteria bacterium]|nr:alpha/beta hydrolase [Candidatus Moranbacteria bacterium]